MLWHWSLWESDGWLPWGRQIDAQGWPQHSVLHRDTLYCNVVYDPLPLLTKGGVIEVSFLNRVSWDK